MLLLNIRRTGGLGALKSTEAHQSNELISLVILKMCRRFLFFLGLSLSTIVCAGAATTTARINVSMMVVGTCGVNTSALTFTNLQTGENSIANAAAASVNVNCSNGTPYSVAVSKGATTLQDERRMRLASSSNHADYDISSHSNATAFSTTRTSLKGAVSNQEIGIDGKAPSEQSPSRSGSYADVVTVTVTY